jgi:hypothetical protein
MSVPLLPRALSYSRCRPYSNFRMAPMKSRLAELGTIPMIFTAAEFGAYVAAEWEKWAKVVQFAGIKPE